MKALVMFDSMFGNTQQIAEAISEGLSTRCQVDVVPVVQSHAVAAEVDLLVVGGPTHAHGMSSARSRKANPAQEAQGAHSAPTGLRELCADLPQASRPVAAATFDTRYAKPAWLTGSAARRAAKRLGARGYRLVAPPESFFVAHAEGPLREGERERARRWGEQLAATGADAASAE
jgi:hypothetical protein